MSDRLGFSLSGWFSTNPYDSRYEEPQGSGIYIYIIMQCFENGVKRVLYVGSSSNLHIRLRDHEIIRIASFFSWNLNVYWKNSENYLSEEIELINSINPPLNIKNKNG